jgi:hypothetical protein
MPKERLGVPKITPTYNEQCSFLNTHFECVTSQKTLANIFRYNKKYKRKMFAFQNPYPLPKTNSTGLCAF